MKASAVSAVGMRHLEGREGHLPPALLRLPKSNRGIVLNYGHEIVCKAKKTGELLTYVPFCV